MDLLPFGALTELSRWLFPRWLFPQYSWCLCCRHGKLERTRVPLIYGSLLMHLDRGGGATSPMEAWSTVCARVSSAHLLEYTCGLGTGGVSSKSSLRDFGESNAIWVDFKWTPTSVEHST